MNWLFLTQMVGEKHYAVMHFHIMSAMQFHQSCKIAEGETKTASLANAIEYWVHTHSHK